VSQIEFLELESKVFEGIKEGNAVLQQLNEQMTIEDVENLMDETRDQIENVNV
jgi:charged multivesicular body protein 6